MSPAGKSSFCAHCKASMSKAMAHRRAPPKTARDRNSSSVDRLSDDEMNRRRPCYQMIRREQHHRALASRELDQDQDQLETLREILSKHPHIKELIEKCNLPNSVPTKNNAKSDCKTYSRHKERSGPVSNGNSSIVVNSNQSEEDNVSINSTEEEIVGNYPARSGRSQTRPDLKPPTVRSVSLYADSNEPPPTSRVSFASPDNKRHEHEANVSSPTVQLKKLLDRLSTELTDLESMTGFKPSRIDVPSNTCSFALASALLALTGHVKQCTPTSKGKHEIAYVKDQLSLVIKTQLDFQQKIEHQLTTLQTMMQTICQLVNSEIISNKKGYLLHHDRVQPDGRSRENWLNTASRSYNISKDAGSAMGNLLTIAQQMRNGTPIDVNLHGAHNETSKGSSRPSSVTSGTEAFNPVHSRSTAVTPVTATPLSYSLFESGLINNNISTDVQRNEIDEANGTSKSDNLLEKIFHERLRLMQQMADLNRQHNATQEELADLEARNQQSRATSQKTNEEIA